MSSHLLSLAALHEAAPGSLPVIFGEDGPTFWTGPVAYDVRIPAAPDVLLYRHLWLTFGLGERLMLMADTTHVSRDRCYLDCRVPSVAARLLKLCLEAARCPTDPCLFWDVCDLWEVARDRSYEAAWTDAHASALAALTLTLAPQIAALGGEK